MSREINLNVGKWPEAAVCLPGIRQTRDVCFLAQSVGGNPASLTPYHHLPVPRFIAYGAPSLPTVATRGQKRLPLHRAFASGLFEQFRGTGQAPFCCVLDERLSGGYLLVRVGTGPQQDSDDVEGAENVQGR